MALQSGRTSILARYNVDLIITSTIVSDPLRRVREL